MGDLRGHRALVDPPWLTAPHVAPTASASRVSRTNALALTAKLASSSAASTAMTSPPVRSCVDRDHGIEATKLSDGRGYEPCWCRWVRKVRGLPRRQRGYVGCAPEAHGGCSSVWASP